MSSPTPDRILYVDDEEALLELTRLFLLRAGGITVDTTPNPREALGRIMTGGYDVVVSDYQMPEMDGIALLKRIREAGSTVPFIIFTGRGREEVAIEALNNGADFYIQKGGDPRTQFAVLANAIRQLAGRRKAEAAFHRSQETLCMAQSLAHLGRWEFDREVGQPVWSDEMFRIYGLIPGRSPTTYEDYLACIHPDDRTRVDAARSESIANGEDNYEIEYRIVRADTGEIRHVVDRVEHQRDESGRILRSTGLVHDITDRRFAEHELLRRHGELQEAYEHLASIEEELRTSFDDLAQGQHQLLESERRLADIIEFLPDATLVIDTSGHVIAWNRAIEEMTGISKADMLGQGDHMYAVPFYGEARPVLIDYANRPDGTVSCPYPVRMRNGGILEGETLLTHPGRKNAVLMIRASPLYDREGRRAGAIEIIRDITEQKEAETELLQKHEELQAAYEQLASIEEELRMSFDDLAESQHRLQASEERYRRISESTSDIIYSCILKGKGEQGIDWIAGATEEITGYTPEEILAIRCWKAIIHPDDLPLFEREILSFVPGRSSLFELRIIRRDGLIRWLRISASCSDNGNGIRLYGGWQDITAQKEAEEALQESEQHFRVLADGGRALIWISGPDGMCSYFNEPWLAFTGRTIEQESGRGWLEGVHPDDRSRFIEIVTGALARCEPFSIAFRLRRHDGEYRWILDDSTPRYDTHGTFLGYIGHCLDVTEQRRMGEALQKTAEKMKKIFHIAPTGIGVVTDGIFTEVNDRSCDIAGYTCNELIGQPVRLLYVSDEEYESVLQEIVAGINETGMCTVETQTLRKNGEIIIIQLSVTPLDPTDISRGMAFTVQDITKQKAIEHDIAHHAGELILQTNSLSVANKKLNLLNSITRHDVLNQLTILLGNLSFIQEAGPDRDLSDLFDRVKGAADQIRCQIEFTRDYTDLGVRFPEWQRVADAIGRAALLGLPVDDATGDLSIYADPMLATVFVNLMDNTLRHGESATRARIRYRPEVNGDLTLIWEDDGIGIPPGEKERIFERCFGRNTGFGLYLIREILGITGIGIIEAGEPGKGARFEMCVPHGAYRF